MGEVFNRAFEILSFCGGGAGGAGCAGAGAAGGNLGWGKDFRQMRKILEGKGARVTNLFRYRQDEWPDVERQFIVHVRQGKGSDPHVLLL